MAGLMPGMAGGQAMPPEQGQPMPQEGGAPMPEGPQASPEDTATYERFLANTMNVIYDERVASGIAPSFQGPSPVEALALFVSGTVARVAYDGLENGQNITKEMAVAATAQIAEDVGTEMAQAVGAQPLNDEQIQALFLRSVELLADQRDDRQMTDMAGRGARPQEAQEAPQGGGAPQAPAMV